MLAVPVNAQTVEYGYSLYLNESLTTHEATKAGGNSFENNYYVTQVSTVRPSKRHFNSYYSGKAVANTKYKLYCKCTGYGVESDKAIVTGRWTP